MDLRVRGEHRPVIRIQPDLRDAQLRVTAGIDGLLEADRLPDGQERRRKLESQRKARFIAVAKVAAQLDARAKRPRVCLGKKRKGTEAKEHRGYMTHS